MRCVACGHEDSQVVETRMYGDGRAIRRRRQCKRCMRRFWTLEQVEQRPLRVVKKDGRREPFDRGKLRRGLEAACQKRPEAQAAIEGLIDGVEAWLGQRGEDTVRASELGERVLGELRRLDPVAYLRFASVYLEFSDAQRFRAEAERILARPDGERPQRPA